MSTLSGIPEEADVADGVQVPLVPPVEAEPQLQRRRARAELRERPDAAHAGDLVRSGSIAEPFSVGRERASALHRGCFPNVTVAEASPEESTILHRFLHRILLEVQYIPDKGHYSV